MSDQNNEQTSTLKEDLARAEADLAKAQERFRKARKEVDAYKDKVAQLTGYVNEFEHIEQRLAVATAVKTEQPKVVSNEQEAPETGQSPTPVEERHGQNHDG